MAYREDEEEKVNVEEGAEEETLADAELEDEDEDLEEESVLGAEQEKEWE